MAVLAHIKQQAKQAIQDASKNDKWLTLYEISSIIGYGKFMVARSIKELRESGFKIESRKRQRGFMRHPGRRPIEYRIVVSECNQEPPTGSVRHSAHC